MEFAKKGFDVTGFDVDASKVGEITAGRSYILDVKTEEVKECVDAGRLRATLDMSHLKEMDAIDICVPTPLRKPKDPDLSYVIQAVDSVKAALKHGQLVILERHVPGNTRRRADGARRERPEGRHRFHLRFPRARRDGNRP